MNDQWWAVAIGAGTMITLRVLDFFMPKGWISTWTKTHAVRASDPDDDVDPHVCGEETPTP